MDGSYTWIRTRVHDFGSPGTHVWSIPEMMATFPSAQQDGLNSAFQDGSRDEIRDLARSPLNSSEHMAGWVLSAQGNPWSKSGNVRAFGSLFDLETGGPMEWHSTRTDPGSIPGRFDKTSVDTQTGTGYHSVVFGEPSLSPFTVTSPSLEVYGIRRQVYTSGVLGDQRDIGTGPGEYKLSIEAYTPSGGIPNTSIGGNIPVAKHEIKLRERGSSIPWSDQSGFRFRQVTLNGKPAPTGKGQAKAESDETPEEVHVDSLTLQLRYDTSDIYVPVAGGEVALAVKRGARPEVWADGRGETPLTGAPGESPFGPCWTTGLSCHLHLDEGVALPNPPPVAGAGMDSTRQDRLTVVDENGQKHPFYLFNVPAADSGPNGDAPPEMVFVPVVTDRNDSDSWLDQLSLKKSPDGTRQWFEFRRKFGTVITFPAVATPLERWVESSPGKFRRHRYYRASEVKDRFGAFLSFSFEAHNTTLVPNEIVQGWPHTDTAVLRRMVITTSPEGLIQSVHDPRGNKWTYTYGAAIAGLNNQISPRLLAKVESPMGNAVEYSYNFLPDNGSANGPGGVLRHDPSLDPAQLPVYNHLNVETITTRDNRLTRVRTKNIASSPEVRTTTISYGWEKAVRFGGFPYGGGAFSYYDPSISRPRVVTGIKVQAKLLASNPSPDYTKNTLWTQRLAGSGTDSPWTLTGPVQLNVQGGNTWVTGSRVVEVVEQTSNGQFSNWFYVYTDPLLCDGSELMDVVLGPGERGRLLDPVIKWTTCRLFYPELGAGQARMVEKVEFDPLAGMADKRVTDASGNVTDYIYGDRIEYSLIQPWFAPLHRLLDSRDTTQALPADALRNRLVSGTGGVKVLPAYHSDPTREIRYVKASPLDAFNPETTPKIIRDFRYYSGTYGTPGNDSPYRSGVTSLMPSLLPRETRLRSAFARVMVESYGPYRQVNGTGGTPGEESIAGATSAITILDNNLGVPLVTATVGRGRDAGGLPADNQILAHTQNVYGLPTFPSFLTSQTVANATWANGVFSPQETTFTPGRFGEVQTVTTKVTALARGEEQNLTATPAEQFATVTTYVNEVGNRELVIDALGNEMNFFYDAENRLVKTSSRVAGGNFETTETEFDNRGRKIWQCDEEGVGVFRIYGANGKPWKTYIDLNGDGLLTNDECQSTNFYDPRDRLILVQSGTDGRARADYDALNRPVRTYEDRTDNGSWTATPAGAPFASSEDALKDAEGAVEYYYGSNSGSAGQLENAGSGAFASSSWKATRAVERRRTITNTGAPSGEAWETKTTFDGLYRPVKTEIQADASTWLVSTTEYDTAGRVIKSVSPHGQIVVTDYDGLGRPLDQYTGFDPGAFSGAPAGTFDITLPSSTFMVTGATGLFTSATSHYYSAGAEYRTTHTAGGETLTSETDCDLSGKSIAAWSSDPSTGQVNRTPPGDSVSGSPVTKT